MSAKSGKKVAIVDLGSARTKVTVAGLDENGSVSTSTTPVEVSLSEAAIEKANGKPVDAFRSIKESVRPILEGEQISSVLYLGAQAFRTGPYAVELCELAKKELPKFAALTPANEAELFYFSVEKENNIDKFIAVDVGGGSVQIIWGEGGAQSCSAKVGTFSLEKEYQTDTSIAVGPGDSAWELMVEAISNAFESCLLNVPKRPHLVFGSNIMRDFFTSISDSLGTGESNGVLSRDTMIKATTVMRGKPYSESYQIFQQNPGFMHGADKLFAVSTTLMEILHFDRAVGTNASVSKGLCRMLLEGGTEINRILLDN